ncbi:tRNA (adenosine(37)-N6)-dimethylallyltransferase MiaA [Mesohalobacter halotolerans]|uniref:tRNA dimethylallyltransferase n=1 Tax=Mesohalobacter halotolerans TaxID=1883405 RepID=A0A4U5TQ48_9FLAO|nr:tRNA (adenosine(37)-N6)-dimethylallyltransferase MiaA [Mesohalobacter halotolerans]TKS56299.1 tRNA (adenosine(37)-N6)-dimethylallyltransferase MiaA [Mesohalobacter halotolerans]
MGNYLICILGPTAIGKTKVSIDIAKAFDTEIISCDSRQFYKEMQIGTAVPSEEELAQVQHHFIQHLSIFEDYSVGDYEKEALKKIDELFQNKNILCLTGGSGLYQKAVLKGLDYFPNVDKTIRKKLNATFENEGIKSLQEQLKRLDPEYYATVDTQNPHRLIRALEICIGTSKPYSSFINTNKTANRDFKVLKIGLTADRKIIYKRIEQRVDKMFDNGLLKEAQSLYQYKNLNALQTVGYKELFEHFDGNLTLDEAKAEIKKNTRRYAKRQLTWYRKQDDIKWFGYDAEIDEILEYIKSLSIIKP